ncbi:cytochrome c biogenesis CcdA family protein, partial [Marinobacter sp. bablab_jr008]|uniref:cytochrome c biogenesis CcdA family protein n=1 Tax=Marinobacter sp. bablab_jr008 TaxID=2755064 RepID=UPI001D18AB3C
NGLRPSCKRPYKHLRKYTQKECDSQRYYQYGFQPDISSSHHDIPLPVAFLLGIAFAVGWTPCIGPILGAILALSSTHANAETGMLYLAVYSLGLALPFLGTALFIEHFRKRVRGFSRWSRPLRALAGLVLIIMGIMVLTGQMTWFATWMLSTFPVLGRLG